MEVSRNAFVATIVVILLIAGGFLFLLSSSARSAQESESEAQSPTIVDGKQVIDLTASISGYSPSVVQAKANTDTVLKVSTKNAFGCANALTIPKLNVNENLKPSGVTEIQIGSQAPGTTIEGLCSMGMYRFVMKFS